MAREDRFRIRIMSWRGDRNIEFAALCRFVERLGFVANVGGSHYVYRRHGCPDIIVLQRDGHLAQAYQVRQVRDVIERNGL